MNHLAINRQFTLHKGHHHRQPRQMSIAALYSGDNNFTSINQSTDRMFPLPRSSKTNTYHHLQPTITTLNKLRSNNSYDSTFGLDNNHNRDTNSLRQKFLDLNDAKREPIDSNNNTYRQRSCSKLTFSDPFSESQQYISRQENDLLKQHLQFSQKSLENNNHNLVNSDQRNTCNSDHSCNSSNSNYDYDDDPDTIADDDDDDDDGELLNVDGDQEIIVDDICNQPAYKAKKTCNNSNANNYINLSGNRSGIESATKQNQFSYSQKNCDSSLQSNQFFVDNRNESTACNELNFKDFQHRSLVQESSRLNQLKDDPYNIFSISNFVSSNVSIENSSMSNSTTSTSSMSNTNPTSSTSIPLFNCSSGKNDNKSNFSDPLISKNQQLRNSLFASFLTRLGGSSLESQSALISLLIKNNWFLDKNLPTNSIKQTSPCTSLDNNSIQFNDVIKLNNSSTTSQANKFNGPMLTTSSTNTSIKSSGGAMRSNNTTSSLSNSSSPSSISQVHHYHHQEHAHLARQSSHLLSTDFSTNSIMSPSTNNIYGNININDNNCSSKVSSVLNVFNETTMPREVDCKQQQQRTFNNWASLPAAAAVAELAIATLPDNSGPHSNRDFHDIINFSISRTGQQNSKQSQTAPGINKTLAPQKLTTIDFKNINSLITSTNSSTSKFNETFPSSGHSKIKNSSNLFNLSWPIDCPSKDSMI